MLSATVSTTTPGHVSAARQVRIRPATTDDIEAIVQLFLALAHETPTLCGYTSQRSLARQPDYQPDALCGVLRERVLNADLLRSTLLVAEANGQVVGFCGAERADGTAPKHMRRYIDKLFVAPAWQGFGLGGRLLAALLHTLRTCGGLPAYLRVEARQTAAVALYQAHHGRELRREESHAMAWLTYGFGLPGR